MNEQHNVNGIGMTSARTRERLVERLRNEGVTNAAVLDRIRAVPRHLFVDEALASRAYEDTALPIGFGQTISQPYVVALMTEALLAGGKKLSKVLEVGTGCGYQTAVLAAFAQHVYSVERIQPLLAARAHQARRAQDQQRELAARRRLARLAQPGAVPRNPGGGCAGADPARAARAARGRRPNDDSDRRARPPEPVRVTRNGTEFMEEDLLAVSFVPFVEGTEL